MKKNKALSNLYGEMEAVETMKKDIGVVLAEDDDSLREAFKMSLSSWGYEVKTANDGDGAWELIKPAKGPLLVISDIQMPNLDGLELCRRIRDLREEEGRKVYVIMITGQDGDDVLPQAFESGCDDFLYKKPRGGVAGGPDLRELEFRLGLGMKRLKEYQFYSRDRLTGLWVRGEIMKWLEIEIKRASRSGKPLCIAFLDLDHFKSVNDRYGHPIGDRVLAGAARHMSEPLRDTDHIGRYGGEEFLVILSDCSLERGQLIAERIRNSVQQNPVRCGGFELRVTASIGLAALAPEKSMHKLLEEADKALYQAKESGRNCVKTA
ncbi:MAG TPA: diguanylate cyclase [Candidatus Paceibacterota bacterium]|nr:diguanylate cyclase [Candidatus Paceibacterota bacterium]